MASFNGERFWGLPDPVQTLDDIPRPYSRTPKGNIILRNDGFNARNVYRFDSGFAHLSNIMANRARMRVDGAIMQAYEADGTKHIDLLWLYNARRPITTGFSADETTGRIEPVDLQGQEPSWFHRNPDAWARHEEKLPSGTVLRARLAYDLPLNFVPDATRDEDRNLDAPAVVVAYRLPSVIDYAHQKFMDTVEPEAQPRSLNGDMEHVVVYIRDLLDRLYPPLR